VNKIVEKNTLQVFHVNSTFLLDYGSLNMITACTHKTQNGSNCNKLDGRPIKPVQRSHIITFRKMELPYILEFNTHPDFGDLLNGKKLVWVSNAHISFHRPMPTDWIILDVTSALKSDDTSRANESYRYHEPGLSQQACAVSPVISSRVSCWNVEGAFPICRVP
jgi:hypothetical protein